MTENYLLDINTRVTLSSVPLWTFSESTTLWKIRAIVPTLRVSKSINMGGVGLFLFCKSLKCWSDIQSNQANWHLYNWQTSINDGIAKVPSFLSPTTSIIDKVKTSLIDNFLPSLTSVHDSAESKTSVNDNIPGNCEHDSTRLKLDLQLSDEHRRVATVADGSPRIL